MTDRVMLDIETLGTDPGCAILQIGAVRFNNDGICHDDGERCEFERSPSLTSCENHGLNIDAETLQWWAEQDTVQSALGGGIPLESALADFASWYGDADEIWAKSPLFDVGILGAAYDAVGQNRPWEFWQTRDVRTRESLDVDVAVDHPGVRHDALDDAIYQAELVVAIESNLGGGSA